MTLVPSRPHLEPPPAAAPREGCPACGAKVADDDRVVCATCKRRVCHACVRPWGHHMLVCEECRLAEW